MLKKGLTGFFILLIIAIVWQHQMIFYGWGQLKGQLHIVWNAKPIEEYLQNDTVSEDMKQKLLLIQEIREYAIESLGVNDSKNYTTLYDQQGKPVLWAVTGSEPYALKPKEWDYPFLGMMAYKGFFEYEKAEKEKKKLEAEGLDAGVRTVGGWSTLGWFKDPILSNMLNRSEGGLANLIIHELTHATLYVKNDVAFNENLASFVGDKGAKAFLIHKYGEDSPEYRAYIHSEKDYDTYTKHILKGAQALDSLYRSFPGDLSDSAKASAKTQMIRQILSSTDTLALHQPERFQWSESSKLPNNTFFMSYLRYRSRQDNFEEEFQEKFQGNLKAYLTYLKEKYPSL